MESIRTSLMLRSGNFSHKKKKNKVSKKWSTNAIKSPRTCLNNSRTRTLDIKSGSFFNSKFLSDYFDYLNGNHFKYF